MPPKAQKRKHTTTRESSPRMRKKPKTNTATTTTPLQQLVASDDEEPSQWLVRAIVEERRVRGRLQYLVDWESHPKTGESYPPEWKFRRDVGDGLLEEWELEKARQKQVPQASAPPAVLSSEATSSFEVQTHQEIQQQQPKRQVRKRRVIDNSSQPELATPRTNEPRSQPSSPVLQTVPGASVPVPEAESSPPFRPGSPPNSTLHVDDERLEGLPEVRVHVTREADFDPDEYQVGLSQALQSNFESSSHPRAVSYTGHTPTTARFGLHTVIPDSQSGTADSSINTTRLGSNRPSRHSDPTEDLPSSRFSEVRLFSSPQPRKWPCRPGLPCHLPRLWFICY